ncbi:MAG: alpha/beta fold hydrolase [Deltaproteobacteria bacterium]|nr:alpha/beta fold hydrolase [Deltaproteobacteria bacterium]
MPYAQAGDVRIYYEAFGKGAPFLFVSGTGWPGEPWKIYQVPAFADRCRVIVYDHRGVGGSDAPDEPYSTRQFASDAANLLDAIGVAEPAHILGHSMGGRVCQWLALDHPGKVRSMILAASGSGAMGDPDYPRELALHSIESMIEHGYEEHIRRHMKSPFFFPGEFVKNHPEEVERLFQAFWRRRPKLRPYLRHVIARNQHETETFLDQISVPTLVLVGGEDSARSDTGNHVRSSEYLRDHIPGARYALVEGCAHGFFWQKPQETNRIISEWLESH